MKTYFLLSIFLVINHLVFGQVNDAQSYLLGTYDKVYIKENKIDSVATKISVIGEEQFYQHSFDTAGNLIYTASKDSKGNAISESFKRYNQYGDEVLKKTIDHEKQTMDSASTERQYFENKLVKETSQSLGYSKVYSYNRSGQLERVIIENENREPIEITYFYDGQGNEVKLVWTQTGARITTYKKYDNKNRIIEQKEMFYSPSDGDEKLSSHKKYYYNKKGKISKKKFLEGYATEENEEFIYDNNNNLREHKIGNSTEKFTWNKEGLLIKKEGPHFLISSQQSVEIYSYNIRRD